MPAETVYFTAPRTIEVREEAVPTPGPNEVLVHAELSMISPGTELLIYRGEAPRDIQADMALDSITGTLDFPLKYGYSVVGDVVEVGQGVDPSWRNEQVVCFHPHSSEFVIPVDDIYRVPETFSTETAAFLPQVETAVNFVLDGQPAISERIVVLGQGVIGLLTTALLAEFPIDTLVGIDPIQHRRDLSRQLGADYVLDPKEDPIETVLSATGDGGPPGGADLTYELSGDPDALDAAISATGFNGRVIVGSWYGTKPTELNLGGRFHRSRIEIRSSQVSTIDPVHRGRWTKNRRITTAWQRLKEIDTAPLTTHRFSVSDAPEAYRLLDNADGEAIGVLITY